ncbi:MAG: hypothetical protein ACK5Y6_00030, partial [Pseudomonadota bacterium]
MVALLGILLTAAALRRLLGISLNSCLPVAFCVVIASASTLVTSLSVFKLISPYSIRLAVLAYCAGLAYCLWRQSQSDLSIPDSRPKRTKWSPVELILLLPITALLGSAATLATLYPPCNWDSMTYHLSRVAMWIQNGSV